MTTPNTEPIPVAQALRLCEMALAQTVGFADDLGCCGGCVLSRAVMRPLIELVKLELVNEYGPDESVGHLEALLYPPLAALRDHYDKTRPDWRKS